VSTGGFPKGFVIARLERNGRQVFIQGFLVVILGEELVPLGDMLGGGLGKGRAGEGKERGGANDSKQSIFHVYPPIFLNLHASGG